MLRSNELERKRTGIRRDSQDTSSDPEHQLLDQSCVDSSVHEGDGTAAVVSGLHVVV